MISSATSSSDLRVSLIPSINLQFSSMSILALLSVINVMVTSRLGVPHLFGDLLASTLPPVEPAVLALCLKQIRLVGIL